MIPILRDQVLRDHLLLHNGAADKSLLPLGIQSSGSGTMMVKIQHLVSLFTCLVIIW